MIQINSIYPKKVPTYKELDRIEYKLLINGVILKLLYCEELNEYLYQTSSFSTKVVSSSIAICTFNYSLHQWRYSAHFDNMDNLFKVMYRLLEEDIPMVIRTHNNIIEFELNSIQYARVMDEHRNKYV
jgi:hypothetical protein